MIREIINDPNFDLNGGPYKLLWSNKNNCQDWAERLIKERIISKLEGGYYSKDMRYSETLFLTGLNITIEGKYIHDLKSGV